MIEDNPMLKKLDQSDCPFAVGELVEQSGIYEICHVDEPRVTVLLTRHTIFPYCRRCGDSVRYRLIQAAPHISEDPDFLEDFKKTDNPPFAMITPNNTFPLQLGLSHGFRFRQDTVPTWRSGSEGGDL